MAFTGTLATSDARPANLHLGHGAAPIVLRTYWIDGAPLSRLGPSALGKYWIDGAPLFYQAPAAAPTTATYAVAGAGGYLFGGAMALLRATGYVGRGGFVFGSGGQALRGRTTVGSGGWVFGAEAVQVGELGILTATIIGSGGFRLQSGAVYESWNLQTLVLAGSGGLVFSGAAEYLTWLVQIMLVAGSGGFRFGAASAFQVQDATTTYLFGPLEHGAVGTCLSGDASEKDYHTCLWPTVEAVPRGSEW